MSDSARRLFVAAWPTDALRERLGALQREIADSCGGRRVKPANLHITLKFLGDVREPQVDSVVEACGAVAFTAFNMTLDRVGFWPRSGIVWVGALRPAEEIARLVEKLEANLAQCGFKPERRRFHAHCTLFRRARRRPQPAFEPLDWGVESFRLVESRLTPEGPVYELFRRFDAGGS